MYYVVEHMVKVEKVLDLPNVSFRCEDSVEKSLWRHPLDGEHGLTTLLVVVRPASILTHIPVTTYMYKASTME